MTAELIVYSRQGCHLCEELIEMLLPIARGRCDVSVVDIDTDSQLQERYNLRVPVLTAGDIEICEGRLDTARLYAFLRSLQPTE
ncbi:MAG: glutaredoxin family protein [Pseudomonadota bacterium]